MEQNKSKNEQTNLFMFVNIINQKNKNVLVLEWLCKTVWIQI